MSEYFRPINYEFAWQKDKVDEAYVEANLPKQELSAIHLGGYRVEIKKHLKEELKEIDKLVGEMINI